jgi:hypothetical protein
VQGREGLRSYALQYTAAGAECYFRSFYAQFQSEKEASFTLLIGTIYNIAGLAFEKLQNNRFTTLKNVANPQAVSFLFTDTILVQGANTYRVALRLQNGNVLYSNPVTIYHFTGAPVIVYPNPARQQNPVTLITDKAGHIRINIYNAAGQRVAQQQLTDLVNSITLYTLAKGIYFIESIEDNGTRSTQKLVVY